MLRLFLAQLKTVCWRKRSAGGLCVSQLPLGRRNVSQTEALCCGKTGHCGEAALGVCAVFRFEDARSYAGSWLG